jgi:antitoxin component of MazEF toxin-antitoxin module
MIKTIVKVGNSSGIILDAALLELAHLKPGDEINIEVHEGGTLTITPIRPHVRPNDEQVSALIKKTMRKYSRTMKKLA